MRVTGGGIVAGGGGGGAAPSVDAPTDASYVTLGTNATLTAERVLTAGTGITLTDAGAGSTLTSSVDTDAAMAAIAHDSSLMWLVDDFPHTGNSTQGQLGTHGWGIYNIAGTTVYAYVDGADTGHPGVIRITSGSAADNNGGGMGLYGGTTALRMFPRLDIVAPWEARFYFKLNSVADVALLMGLGRVPNADPPTTGFVMRFDTDQSDTAYMAMNLTGTATTMGVAADTNWHMYRLRSAVAGTILHSIDGGTEVAKTDGAITNVVSPFVNIITRVGTAKSVDIDRFSFTWTGLTR